MSGGRLFHAEEAARPISVPATVRGRLLFLTGGRRGTPDDAFAAAAALLLDAALDGAVAVGGRRRLGIDRRRVIPGPAPLAAATAPLVADLRHRVEATQDTPWGWCERLAGSAADAAAQELIDAGLATGTPAPWRRRLVRHRTLAPADPADPAAAPAVREGVAAFARG